MCGFVNIWLFNYQMIIAILEIILAFSFVGCNSMLCFYFSCHKCHKDQNKCHFTSVAQFGTRYYTKWSSTTYILIFCDMCVYIFTEIFSCFWLWNCVFKVYYFCWSVCVVDCNLTKFVDKYIWIWLLQHFTHLA